jgi:L,D-peptidoglycan transpeptidase YkuD (ErfK/YbiS/YcfS/YnhG family)
MTGTPQTRYRTRLAPAVRTLTVAASLAAVVAATVVTGGGAQAADGSPHYTVKFGDSLSAIALRRHVPGGWAAIARANHLAAPYVILPGQQLALPDGSDTATAAEGFPVPVKVGKATQVITVKAKDSHATVAGWELDDDGVWQKVFSTNAARVGAKGITDGATRKQGSRTTPTGTYTITQGFGTGPAPDSAMPYHRVTAKDWWVEDPTSAYYNQMRSSDQGGFHATASGANGSEHLIDHPDLYREALFIDYNAHPAVKGRGAGIFLHDLGPKASATDGCVAVPADLMAQIMKWVDPAEHPVIAIG